MGIIWLKGFLIKRKLKFLKIILIKSSNQIIQSGENIDGTWEGNKIKKIADSRDQILHTHNVHQYSGQWLRAMLHPKFLEVATAILGEDVVLHHSKLFQKPAEKGSPFPIHQDWSYFPTQQDSMIAGMIHVTDATDKMGCLRVYAGSHKLGRQIGTNGQVETNSDILEKYPIQKAKIIEASAGDVLFFHYFTLHGSMPNRSDRTRKTVLVQMHAGEDKIEEDVDHPYEAIVLNGWNHASTRTSVASKK